MFDQLLGGTRHGFGRKDHRSSGYGFDERKEFVSHVDSDRGYFERQTHPMRPQANHGRSYISVFDEEDSESDSDLDEYFENTSRYKTTVTPHYSKNQHQQISHLNFMPPPPVAQLQHNGTIGNGWQGRHEEAYHGGHGMEYQGGHMMKKHDALGMQQHNMHEMQQPRAYGMQHGSYNGMQHGSYDGMQHGSYDRIQHGSYDGMQHDSFDGMQHHGELGLQQYGSHGAHEMQTHGAYEMKKHGMLGMQQHDTHEMQKHNIHEMQKHGAYEMQKHNTHEMQKHDTYGMKHQDRLMVPEVPTRHVYMNPNHSSNIVSKVAVKNTENWRVGNSGGGRHKVRWGSKGL